MSKRNLIIAGLLLVALMTGLAGCGKTALSPEDSIKVYGEIFGKLDFSNIEKIKMKPDETKQEEAMQGLRKNLEKQWQTQMRKARLTVSKEQLAQVVDARLEAQKKLDVKTELISKNDKEAVVKLTMTYIDETAMGKEAAELVAKETAGKPATAQNRKLAGEMFCNEIIKKYQNFQPGETKSIDVECKLDEKKQVWIPTSLKDFSKKINHLLIGIE